MRLLLRLQLGLMLVRVKMEFEFELRLELVSNPPGTRFSGEWVVEVEPPPTVKPIGVKEGFGLRLGLG